jgi:hypothetical protein
MTATPKALRTRNMGAAKRSATLIRDAVLMHLKILEEGKVPESSFSSSVMKYLEALTVLRTLDALGEDGASPDGEGCHDPVVMDRNDLYVLITLLRQSDMAEVLAQAKDGSPIGHLLAAVEPGPEKGQEETS